MIILFFVLSYGIGLFVGFLSNSYSRTLTAIISNTFCQIIIIVASEIFRYAMIRANQDKKVVVVLTTIILTIFELVITLQAVPLTDYAGLFRMVTATALPIISKNIVISYLVYHIGYVPGLIYRLVMDLYIFIMPIVPDLGDYLNSMLGIGLPFLIYLYASRTINEYNNGVERNYGTETFKLVEIPFIVFMSILICLISGFFPYFMITFILRIRYGLMHTAFVKRPAHISSGNMLLMTAGRFLWIQNAIIVMVFMMISWKAAPIAAQQTKTSGGFPIRSQRL
jgi:hypothetical protein